MVQEGLPLNKDGLVLIAEAIAWRSLPKRERGVVCSKPVQIRSDDEAPEHNLLNMPAAISVLYRLRINSEISIWEMEQKSGVSYNAGVAWRSGKRFPQLSNLVAMAQIFGFSIIMRSKAREGDEHDLSCVRSAIRAIDEARRTLGMSTKDIKRLSGVSINSFYAWLNEERDPTMGLLVNLAEAVGFEIVMRRAT